MPTVRVIVCLGGFAWDAALRGLATRDEPSPAAAEVRPHGRGRAAERATTCSARYHPSQQNTFTGKLTEEMTDAVFRARRPSSRYAERFRAFSRPTGTFTPQVRDWFARAFAEPTEAQTQAWPAIARGENVLLSAPTGSGKTLAAFLWGLDRLVAEPAARGGAQDAPRLRLAAQGALLRHRAQPARAARRASAATIDVAIRTGDTPQKERAAMLRKPPDILITTPESLYLMLTSRAREILPDVEWVIVDEIHAVAQTKRGAHLALTLERLEHARAGRTRVAAHRPVGHAAAARGGRPLPRRHRRASARSSTPACASRSTSRSTCRSRT